MTSGMVAEASELTQQDATQMLRDGRYEELEQQILTAREDASGSELMRLNKMLSSIKNYRSSRKSDSPDENEAKNMPGKEAENKTGDEPRNTQEDEVKLVPRIITIGGFTGGWHTAISYTSPYGKQQWTFSKTFPSAWIKNLWDQDYRITGVAGAADEWFVVMSLMKDGTAPAQAIRGPSQVDDEFQTKYAKLQADGYRVTSLGGFDKTWVMVFTSDTGWGRQRFKLPGSLDADWVRAREKEGYHITAGSGDIIENKNDDFTSSFMLVATQGTGYQAPTWWLHFTKGSFMPWFKNEIETKAPLVLMGYREAYGACLSSGTPFGTNCGYMFGAGSEQIGDWLSEQNCNK